MDKFILRKKHTHRRFPLRKFDHLAGWMNWGFNVFPLLRPSLNSLYAKIAPLSNPYGGVTVSQRISDELEWAERHIKQSDGVVILRELDWTPKLADFTIFCDASKTGLGIWLSDSNEGFIAKVPSKIPEQMNFFREALAASCAIDFVAKRRPNSKIVIDLDNENTVNMLSSFAAKPEYNPLLIFVSTKMIEYRLQLKALHIAGVSNRIADALSRHQIAAAKALSPGINITSFNPPPDALGTYREQCRDNQHNAKDEESMTLSQSTN